mgnify:CR=1 FL=1
MFFCFSSTTLSNVPPRLVDEWVKQIRMLAKSAKIDPHSAYAAYTHSLRHKYTYAMQTSDVLGSDVPDSAGSGYLAKSTG